MVIHIYKKRKKIDKNKDIKSLKMKFIFFDKKKS